MEKKYAHQKLKSATMNKRELKQSNIFEKVFLDKEGRLVRATFEVYEINGTLKARLLNFVYETVAAISGQVLKLSNFVKSEISKLSFILKVLFNPSLYSLVTIYSTGSK